MKKKILAIILIGVLAIGVLSACGSTTSESTASESTTNEKAATFTKTYTMGDAEFNADPEWTVKEEVSDENGSEIVLTDESQVNRISAYSFSKEDLGLTEFDSDGVDAFVTVLMTGANILSQDSAEEITVAGKKAYKSYFEVNATDGYGCCLMYVIDSSDDNITCFYFVVKGEDKKEEVTELADAVLSTVKING